NGSDVGSSPLMQPVAAVFSGDGKPLDVAPQEAYEAFLAQTLERVQRPSADPPTRPYRLEMVSHLSTSGFIAPLIFARRWLASHTPEDSAGTPKLRQTFWREFLQSVHFGLSHAAHDPPRPREERVIRFSYSARPDLTALHYQP